MKNHKLSVRFLQITLSILLAQSISSLHGEDDLNEPTVTYYKAADSDNIVVSTYYGSAANLEFRIPLEDGRIQTATAFAGELDNDAKSQVNIITIIEPQISLESIIHYTMDDEGLSIKFTEKNDDIPAWFMSIQGKYHAIPDEEALALAKTQFDAITLNFEKQITAWRAQLPNDEERAAFDDAQDFWKEMHDAGWFLVALDINPEDEASFANPAYWHARADHILSRQRYLGLRFSPTEGEEPYGTWWDGEGGSLILAPIEMEALGEDGFEFQITVVRGPTAHYGLIEGRAWRQDNELYVFEDSDEESFVDGKPARIEFRWQPPFMKIKTENTQHYHGARAYFEGEYLRLPRFKGDTEIVEAEC